MHLQPIDLTGETERCDDTTKPLMNNPPPRDPRDYGRQGRLQTEWGYGNSLFVPGPVLYGRFIGRSGLDTEAAAGERRITVINRYLEGVR